MRIDKDIPNIFTPEKDEKLEFALHRKFISFLINFIVSFFIIIGIGFSYSLQYIYEFISLDIGVLFTILSIFLLILIVILSLVSIIGIFYVRGHLYLVTNFRIIVYKKFITKQLREVRYEKIKDVILQQGLFGRIFNYGSVIPTTAGMELGGMRRNILSFISSIIGIKDPNKIRKNLVRFVDSIQIKR